MSHLQNTFFAKFASKPEVNSGISDTVPNQSLPMKEILSKAAAGIPVHITRPQFDTQSAILSGSVDPFNRPGFNQIDLAEMQLDLSAASPKNSKQEKPDPQPDPQSDPQLTA